jgi:hypothetical protein
MKIRNSFAASLKPFSFVLERFFPRFIRSFLNKKLREIKDKGAIKDYKLKVKRKRKYYYTIEVDLFFDMKKGGEKSDGTEERTSKDHN